MAIVAKSNLKKLASLLEDLRSRGEDGTANYACVDALRFLDGNEDEASIGCNLEEHPGLKSFREVVKRIAARPDVSGVQVYIQEDMGDDEFPYTDSILVCTSATPEVLAEEFAELTPDDVFKTDKVITKLLPKPPAGHKWYNVWWD